MERALEADGEKLRQLTGKDHGPVFLERKPAFRFWGINSDGTRDLIGWAKADTISEALSIWPTVVTTALDDYDKIEIIKMGSEFDV